MTADDSESEPLAGWTGRFNLDRWAPEEGNVTVRTLRELRGLFRYGFNDERSADLSEDTIVYRVWRLHGDEEQQIPEVSITSIEAGTVRDEFFMTHGHRHAEIKGETYMCLGGNGGILARAGDHIRWYAMQEGDVVQLPGVWAHRAVNTGYGPFVFSGHYSAPFTVSYDEILRDGMGASVVRTSDDYYEVRSGNGAVLSHGRRR